MVNANGKLISGFSHFSSRTKTKGPRHDYMSFEKNAETERELTKLQFLSKSLVASS